MAAPISLLISSRTFLQEEGRNRQSHTCSQQQRYGRPSLSLSRSTVGITVHVCATGNFLAQSQVKNPRAGPYSPGPGIINIRDGFCQKCSKSRETGFMCNLRLIDLTRFEIRPIFVAGHNISQTTNPSANDETNNSIRSGMSELSLIREYWPLRTPPARKWHMKPVFRDFCHF